MLRAAFALAIVCVSLTVAAAQPPKPAVTMDDIKKAWQERQDKVKTLKMSWKRVVVKPKGSLDFVIPRLQLPNVTAPQPPRDVRLLGEADFVLSEDRFRFDTRRQTWWMASQSPKPYRHSAVYDGKDYRHSDSSVADPTKEQTAIQSATQASVSVERLELYPVWWCVRGAKGVLGDDPLSKYDTEGRTVVHKGVACVRLEAKSRSANSSTHLTLTLDGYLPVTFVHSVQGKPVTQLDIEYEKKTGAPLLPSKWRYVTRFSSELINESFEATVTTSEVGVLVAESRFQLTSPPGTVIVDTRLSDENQGGERVGVVLPDGTASETVDRRAVKSYEGLVAATQPRAAWWPWIVAGILGVIAGVIGYVVMKRRRRSV